MYLLEIKMLLGNEIVNCFEENIAFDEKFIKCFIKYSREQKEEIIKEIECEI